MEGKSTCNRDDHCWGVWNHSRDADIQKGKRRFQTWAFNPDSWEIHPGSQTAPASQSFCSSHHVAHLDSVQGVHQCVLKQCRKQQPQRVAAPLPVPSPVLYRVSAMNQPYSGKVTANDGFMGKAQHKAAVSEWLRDVQPGKCWMSPNAEDQFTGQGARAREGWLASYLLLWELKWPVGYLRQGRSCLFPDTSFRQQNKKDRKAQ